MKRNLERFVRQFIGLFVLSVFVSVALLGISGAFAARRSHATAVAVEPANAEVDNPLALRDAQALSAEFQSLAFELQKLSGPRASLDCDASGRQLKREASPQCVKRYTQLFSKDTVDIRIAFGFLDPEKITATDRDSVDRYFYSAFIEQITRPCLSDGTQKSFACGFQRNPDDATKMWKMVKDPYGRERRVILQVWSSSIDSHGRQNEFIKARQDAYSAKSRDRFMKGLAQADVVIYNGHARGGGGPDFYPALRKPDQSINYSAYQKTRPGLNDLQEALASRKDGGPQLLGLIGCSTKKHFYKDVKPLAQGSGLVTTKSAIYQEDSLRTTYSLLDSILGQRCEEDFEKALNLRNHRHGLNQLDGFFK